MNILVTYTSKYGSTERYARWIAEALGCEARKAARVSPKELAAYDIIIHGGGLYAGSLAGIQIIIKNFNALAGKRLILFSCGFFDPADPENVRHIEAGIARSLTPQMQETVKQFHFRGGLDYSRMGVLHRLMMAGLRGYLLRQGCDTLRPGDREIVDTYGEQVDHSDKASIAPLVEYVRSL